MKIRHDFVTNSSSSSFILAFNSKEEGCEKISSLKKEYDVDCVNQLLDDFIAAEPIAYENLLFNVAEEFEGDINWDLCVEDHWWRHPSRKSFMDIWLENHAGADWADFYESSEYKNEVVTRVNAMFKDFVADIGNRSHIVNLEYGDHDRFGSALEHEILPECDFTVRRFSHH